MHCYVKKRNSPNSKAHLYQAKETKCHHWQCGLVTDAEGHMTPHAPISDHTDLTVPDGSDVSPTPLSRPCHRQLQGQSSGESGGRLVNPQDTRGDEPPESGVRLWPLWFIVITRLFPVTNSILHKWFECLGAGTLLVVLESLPCLWLSIGHFCGLLPLARVVEDTPLETFSFYFTLSVVLSKPYSNTCTVPSSG